MKPEWTPERIALLKVLWDSGLSARQCGAELGVTRNAVISKVHRSGFAARKSSQWASKVAFPRPNRKRGAVQCRIAASPRIISMDEIGAVDAVLNLAPGGCHWPIGDPFDAGFYFCGEATQQTYCPQHHALAYVRQGAGR